MLLQRTVCALAAFGTVVAAAQSQDLALRPTSPGVRTSHALVYHDRLQRVVMPTGDREQSQETLWTWDGQLWTALAGAGPVARSLGGATYDSARDVLVVHGGAPGRVSLGDTWEWNAGRWTQRGAQLLRDHHALTYDHTRGRTVLFGGWQRPRAERGSWTSTTEVSEWDGHRWHTIAADGPGARISPALVFDAARRHVVLFGGGAPDAALYGDTWAWDGQQWRRLATYGPPARRAHAMAFDMARNVVLLFGGTNGTSSFGDLWQWDGSRWAELTSPTPGPGARFGAAIAWDTGRQTLVLHGGFQDGRIMGDTWEWSGDRWSRASPR